MLRTARRAKRLLFVSLSIVNPDRRCEALVGALSIKHRPCRGKVGQIVPVGSGNPFTVKADFVGNALRKTPTKIRGILSSHFLAR